MVAQRRTRLRNGGLLVQGQAGGGFLLLGERIVVRCEGEVMVAVAG